MVRLIDATPVPLGRVIDWAKRNGRIRGLKMHVVQDLGAYPKGTDLAELTGRMSCGCYDIPALEFRSVGVYTNKMAVGALNTVSPKINWVATMQAIGVPALDSVMVRSHMPGSVASGMCSWSSKTRCS